MFCIQLRPAMVVNNRSLQNINSAEKIVSTEKYARVFL